jgi:Cu-Zn family superoxide dismutase
MGEVVFMQEHKDVRVHAIFTHLPPGAHGFHIHTAGDLRGIGCKGACDHFHVGPPQNHGGPPGMIKQHERHTGDLGNIYGPPFGGSDPPKGGPQFEAQYLLKNLDIEDLWGRSVIVHEDPDDLGMGLFEDSITTGHSGKRIGCAIIGRVVHCAKSPSPRRARTFKNRR